MEVESVEITGRRKKETGSRNPILPFGEEYHNQSTETHRYDSNMLSFEKERQQCDDQQCWIGGNQSGMCVFSVRMTSFFGNSTRPSMETMDAM